MFFSVSFSVFYHWWLVKESANSLSGICKVNLQRQRARFYANEMVL